MIKCPFCNSTYPENTLFCEECGSYLSPGNGHARANRHLAAAHGHRSAKRHTGAAHGHARPAHAYQHADPPDRDRLNLSVVALSPGKIDIQGDRKKDDET